MADRADTLVAALVVAVVIIATILSLATWLQSLL